MHLLTRHPPGLCPLPEALLLLQFIPNKSLSEDRRPSPRPQRTQVGDGSLGGAVRQAVPEASLPHFPLREVREERVGAPSPRLLSVLSRQVAATYHAAHN